VDNSLYDPDTKTWKLTNVDGLVVDLNKAHSLVIVHNRATDKHYSPYCGRCPGLDRMKPVEPFLWKHFCGAIHDERQVIVK
jgi:hypothetical protein